MLFFLLDDDVKKYSKSLANKDDNLIQVIAYIIKSSKTPAIFR